MTNEIQVGEYVRTKYGDIFKLAKFYDGTPLYSMQDENGILYGNPNKVVKKHSFNLIDLIEAGDYVNGSKVYRIYEPNVGNMYERRVTTEEDDVSIGNEQITSILTKEQFKAMEYKVGGEND